MFAEKYITASCVISDNTIIKDSKLVFENKHATLQDFLLAVYNNFNPNYPKFYKMDNLCKLGWLASEMLLKESFKLEKYLPVETGLVLMNANASLDTDLKYFETIKDIPSPSVFVYTLPNIMMGEICIRNNFKGENAFFVSDEFDIDFFQRHVNYLIDNHIMQVCICGWVDLLWEDYKAVLFLVEKEKTNNQFYLQQEIFIKYSIPPMGKKINSDVFVAGVGAITAIGNNTTDSLAAFEQERAGMGYATYLDTAHRKNIPVVEVKMTNEELARKSGLSTETSRTALLSVIAAKEAMDNAGIENFAAMRTGFISANTVGGMDKSEKFFKDFLSNPQKGKLREVVNHECGSVSELVADKLGIRNYISTISTACSSSANAIFFGARLIKHGMLDVVVAGGADALTKFTLNGFKTLMILDKEYCRPFDENRKGLNLGEGAGYVVLVSERAAASLKATPVCKLSGYCNRNDAYHQTASSPDGTGSWLAMKGALESSGLQPEHIDYINLHGTGTQNNDLSEGIAIKRLFEPHYPKVSSTKSFTGHTLGASGGVEAVFSVLAIKHGIIYPNLRFTTQMAELPFAPETHFSKNVSVKHVLSNSFGFGGNCTSLIFSKL